MENTYSEEEISNLRQMFDIFDSEKRGEIDRTDMQKVLQELGHSSDAVELPRDSLNFDEFLTCLSAIERQLQDPSPQPPESSDPDSRVLDFLK